MGIEYQFIMHHSGRLPNVRSLNRLAQDFNGGVIDYQSHYTGNLFQAILDDFEPLFDPIEHTGRLITVRFNSQETIESFLSKLKRIGVSLREERVTQSA